MSVTTERRYSMSRVGFFALTFSALCSVAVQAADITLAGTLPGRAIFSVDGSTRTLRAGQSIKAGVRLLSVDGTSAVVDINGQQQVLRVGQRAMGSASGEQIAVLQADQRGQFLASGTINGKQIRFLVDTGATMVSLGASDARRLGLDLSEGVTGTAQTAAGPSPVTRILLDSVHVGDIKLDGIDALVHDNDLPIALLGMSFLNRTDMQREGSTMKLKKRY